MSFFAKCFKSASGVRGRTMEEEGLGLISHRAHGNASAVEYRENQSRGIVMAVFERCMKSRMIRRPALIKLCCTVLAFTSMIGWYIYQVENRPPIPWRALCRNDAAAQFTVRASALNVSLALSYPRLRPDHVDNLGRYYDYLPTLEPLTPQHPSWPYETQNLPSLLDANSLKPVGVLIAIITSDYRESRRHLIRSTFGSHPESRKSGTEGVKIVFVLGRPKSELVDRVAKEAETHGDIIILDVEEGRDNSKVYHLMVWAAQHAHVPACKYALGAQAVCVGSRQPDYLVKADDDSFIMVGELERRLRILPREKAHWGRLNFRNWDWLEYVNGGVSALSMDLVKYIATSEYALANPGWREDQRLGDWLRAHPQGDQVIWVTDRCWMYDHPRGKTDQSIGFLFPNVVRAMRNNIQSFQPTSLPDSLRNVWSTVTPLNRVYEAPLVDLPIERRAEALTEGSPLSLIHRHNWPYIDFPTSKGTVDREEAWTARPSWSERMRGAEYGSTVFVHKVKEESWWKETAMALLGPD